MADKKMQQVTEFLATIGGGAGAGFVDTKFASTKVLGMGPGVLAGIALAGAGLAFPKQLGKAAAPVLAAGEGALAGEAYRMTAERTTASISGVGFMSRRLGAGQQRAYQLGMNQGRAISQAEVAARLAALRSRGGAQGGIY